MKESYDAVLVHGYTDESGFSGNFGERNEMQATAAEVLYRSGYVKNIVLAGGNYWGEDRTTFADAMATRLTANGINPEHIVIKPQTTTTSAEIDVFLEQARERGWEDLASLSTRTHTPRISINYLKRRRRDVDQVRAERVLFNIKEGNAFPHRDFLKRFRSSEGAFIVREAFAITFDLYGLGRLGQRFSDSGIGKRIKAKLDK